MNEDKKDQFVTQSVFKTELRSMCLDFQKAIQEQTNTLRTEFKAGLYDFHRGLQAQITGLQNQIKSNIKQVQRGIDETLDPSLQREVNRDSE